MSELQSQCWFCHYCHDDKHHEPGSGKCIENIKRDRDQLAAHVERLREALSEALEYADDHPGMPPTKSMHDALNETPGQSFREVRAEALEEAAKTLMPSMPSQPDDPPEGFNDYCEALAEVKRYAQQLRGGES